MNSPVLDFTSRLDPEEREYTTLSLEPIKNTILSKLDIVEVAQKLGIELQELPRDSDERKNYGSERIYMGNCPQCIDGE